MWKKVLSVFGFIGAVCLTVVSNASAELVLTGVTPDISGVETVAALILAALMGIWAIRKLIKLSNRS